jgi:hypothetical protein
MPVENPDLSTICVPCKNGFVKGQGPFLPGPNIPYYYKRF